MANIDGSILRARVICIEVVSGTNVAVLSRRRASTSARSLSPRRRHATTHNRPDDACAALCAKQPLTRAHCTRTQFAAIELARKKLQLAVLLLWPLHDLLTVTSIDNLLFSHDKLIILAAKCRLYRLNLHPSSKTSHSISYLSS